MLALVKAFLKAGVLNDLGDREETLTGTPQGGILPRCWPTSRCRCWTNISPGNGSTEMGNPISGGSARRNGLGNWRLIRYADDFVVDGVR